MSMTGKDIILGLLLEKSRTGYEINEVFDSVFRHFYKTSYGMIYPTLKRLSQDGLVTKEVVIQNGKPNKNIYHITDAGKKTFHDYLETSISPEKRESEFLVRMYFGGNEDEQIIESWLKSEISLLEENINDLKNNHIVWEEKMTYTQRIVYEIGLAQFEIEKEILQNKLLQITSGD